MTKQLRCAIYIRVSTEEQHLNGLSLPAQKKALTDYAAANGYDLIGCYADEGISARKSMKYRKGLLSLLEDVKQDKIDMILVTKLDRWFRNIKDYNITEEILQAHRCYWKTIYENYDSSTANGQMVINIMLSVNQAECDRTSERIKAVLDYKRSIGEVTSGKCACYGYKTVNNRLVKDETVSHIIDDAYRHYFTCYSVRNTIAYLNEKYGDEAPSANKVDRLFKNETYAGKDKNNYRYCEPYISLEQFEAARRITRSKIRSGNHEPYLFGSLIKCPLCGNNYTGYRKKYQLKNGGESIYTRYRCGNKFNRHAGMHLTEHLLEDYMILHVLKPLETETIILKADSKQRLKKDSAAGIQTEIDRLNLQFQKGRIREDYYDSQYEILSERLRKQKEKAGRTPPESRSQTARPFTGNWTELYRELDNTRKNAFWKSIIRSIQLDPQSHNIKEIHFI